MFYSHEINLKKYNYDVLTNIMNNRTPERIESLIGSLKYICVMKTKDTLCGKVARTLLNRIGKYGNEFYCTDKQKWAVAIGAAEESIRIYNPKSNEPVSNRECENDPAETYAPVETKPIISRPANTKDESDIDMGEDDLPIPVWTPKKPEPKRVISPDGVNVKDTVTIRDMDSLKEWTWMIVDFYADTLKGTISSDSLLARKLRGCLTGETVEVNGHRYTITSIKKDTHRAGFVA